MTTIELYLFDELPEEVQKKAYKIDEYEECPWTYEMGWQWWNFVESLYSKLKIRWDNYYECYAANDYDEQMRGKRLVKCLYKELGYWMAEHNDTFYDDWIFRYALDNLGQILKQKMAANDYMNYVRRYIDELIRQENEYYNSFEGYKERAESNEWLFTENGQMVYV